MTSGLIQLVTYSAQDIFLTGNPQVTFFKAVYRRHTNFAIETIELPLEGSRIAFDETLTCRVDKLADLMWKTHLVVDLPSVSIPRVLQTPDPHVDLLQQRAQTALTSYTTIHNYVGLVMALYRASVKLIQPGNPSSASMVISTITNLLASLDPSPSSPIQTAFANLIIHDCPITGSLPSHLPADLIATLSILNAAQTTPVAKMRERFDYLRTQLQLIEQKYWIAHREAQVAYQSAAGVSATNQSPLCKFAWVRHIGHFIAEWIDIYIGGNKIDRQWGEWINIWYELTGSHNQHAGYAEMIGDTPEMTTFNSDPKPATTIAVPIPFWFCRDNGLALPLIALDYYDVEFVVKFRKMEELCYTDVAGALDPDIVRIADARFWIDYIYLDAGERRRFAQSSHEYLIQQVQMEEFTDFSLSQHNFDLHFNNSVRELVWVYQREDFVNNVNDTIEPQWGNYTLDRWPTLTPSPPVLPKSPQSTVDLWYNLIPNRDTISIAAAAPRFPTPEIAPRAPRRAIKSAQLMLNQQTRTEVQEPIFFESLQSYEHHRSGGIPGVNMLCFSRVPEISQPTGSCNMSLIDSVKLNIVWNYEALYNNGFQLSGRFRVYALSNNILRIMSGVGGLAFAY
jgi:hypothetical protein